MAELIDIYDENKNHIGTSSRNEAHQKGLWHKAVHIYIVNDKNEILIQKRSKEKDLYPNVWDISCGGHVDAGETAEITAIRECFEELGIKLEKRDINFVFTVKETLISNNYISNEFVDVFVCKADLSHIVKQDGEVAETKVVKILDFVKMISSNDGSFLPHVEYERIIPILGKYIKQ